MSAETKEGMILVESDIKDIVREIEEAKRFAQQVPEFRFARLHGSLYMILQRIDKRIGDVVWME